MRGKFSEVNEVSDACCRGRGQGAHATLPSCCWSKAEATATSRTKEKKDAIVKSIIAKISVNVYEIIYNTEKINCE